MVLEAAELFPNARVVCLASEGDHAAKERARTEAMKVGGVDPSFVSILDMLPHLGGWGAADDDRPDFFPPYVASRMLEEMDGRPADSTIQRS